MPAPCPPARGMIQCLVPFPPIFAPSRRPERHLAALSSVTSPRAGSLLRLAMHHSGPRSPGQTLAVTALVDAVLASEDQAQLVDLALQHVEVVVGLRIAGDARGG